MRLRLLQPALAAFLLLLPVMAGSQTMTMPEAKAPTGTQAAPATPVWPAVDGTVVLDNFRFGTGDTLPTAAALPDAGHAAPQCYRPRGQCGAAAARNGRQRALAAESHFFQRAVWAGLAARHHEILPHPA